MHVWALTSSAEKLTEADSSGLVTHVSLHRARTPHSALISRETKVSLIEIHTRSLSCTCCYSSSGSSKESLDACARRAFFLCDLRSSAISLSRLCQSQRPPRVTAQRPHTGTYTPAPRRDYGSPSANLPRVDPVLTPPPSSAGAAKRVWAGPPRVKPAKAHAYGPAIPGPLSTWAPASARRWPRRSPCSSAPAPAAPASP